MLPAHEAPGEEVVKDPQELAEVDLREARLALDDEHVLVVVLGGWLAEVGRSRDDEGVGAQWVYQRVLGMDVEDVSVQPGQPLREQPSERGVSVRRADGETVSRSFLPRPLFALPTGGKV